MASPGRTRRPHKPRPPSPPPRDFQTPTLIVVGLLVVGAFLYQRFRPFSPPPPSVLSGASADSSSAEDLSRLSPDDPAGRTNTLLAQHCPHLARFDSSRYTREAGKVAKELVNAKCLESLCDSSGPLIALEPTARGQMQQLCGQLRSTMERQKEELNKLGRRWCPEAVQVWEGKPWSAAAHRRFYEEKRRCFEQGCRTAERGDLESGTYMDCEIAADTAEALGAPEDAARLREVARVVEARWRQMRESLTPEERKARNEKAMRRMAEAWNEECREGNQRLCAAVAMYCSAESEPSELCPKPGRGPAAPDAGNR